VAALPKADIVRMVTLNRAGPHHNRVTIADQKIE
jgi:hypothetical protein